MPRSETYTIIGLKREEYPELYDITFNLMKKFELHKVRVSIKANLNNAYALGIGNYICLGKPLIEKLSVDELEGVIAHEFSHIHLRHSLTAVFLSFLFMFPLLIFFITYNPNNPTSAVLFLVGIIILIYGYKIRNWITLHQEINADFLAIAHTKKANALENALLKIEIENLSSKESFLHALMVNGILWVIAYLFGVTHPKITDRIQYITLLSAVEKIE